MKPIYLDNNATTRLDPRVLKVMMPYLTEEYGNPSSRTHRYGWQAEEAIEKAREQVALLINADPNQIIFTSGATESNNMAINDRDSFCVMSAIEHSSIKNTLTNFETKEIKVNKDGMVDLTHLKSFLYPPKEDHIDIECVYVMMVNNEIGTIQPIKEISKMLPEYTNFHSDMAQALGKIKIDVKELGVTSASFSAHKIYGPKGVGALYIKDPTNFSPLICGGSHEFGLRAGTQNVPGIVGFGKACEIIHDNPDYEKIQGLRNFLCYKLKDVPNVVIHDFPNAVPNTVNIAVPCKNMDVFMTALEPHVSISFGSACMSQHNSQSYVLKAVSIPEEEILRSIRIGIGRFNTPDDMVLAASYIGDAILVANSLED